jgi:hypothetical protein
MAVMTDAPLPPKSEDAPPRKTTVDATVQPTDLTMVSSAPMGKSTSSNAAVAGGTVAAAVCAIAIFHFNELLLHYGMTPIPTEIAAEYQIVFSWMGAVVAHRFS